MKKKLLYFSVALASLFTATVFTSCNEKDKDEDDDSTTTSAFDGRLSGTIKTESGAALNSEIDQLAIYYPSGNTPRTFAVTTGGAFDFTLPAVTAADLYELAPPAGISITPTDAQFMQIEEILAYKNGSAVGEVIKINGSTSLLYMYANKNAIIKGTTIDGSLTTIYNLTLKTGWNTIVGKVETIDSKRVETLTTGNVPTNLLWIFFKDSAQGSPQLTKAAKSGNLLSLEKIRVK
jgi:hypothetical protein